jgi:hypothetical protein
VIPLENLKVELEITGFYSQSDNYFISFIFNLEDYPHFLVGFWLKIVSQKGKYSSCAQAHPQAFQTPLLVSQLENATSLVYPRRTPPASGLNNWRALQMNDASVV